MPTILDILINVIPLKTIGDTTVEVTDLCIDSRLATVNSAFIAINGTNTNGHDFIDNAISLGAKAVICERLPRELSDSVTYIQVSNSAKTAGIIANVFFDYPSKQINVIGVTGTNGKTTTATLLFQLFEGLGYKCGLLSTVQNQIHKEVINATHTTPDAISLHRLLRKMADAGCSHAFMEVSSHAIHQDRISGILFAGAIFTNITHDHLDYHKTFDEYIRVKKCFFDNLPKSAFALTNADDKRGLVMLQNTAAKKKTYSLKIPTDIKGKIISNTMSGLVMLIDNQEIHFRLIGEFNAYNLLAVYGAAILSGEDKIEVLTVLSNLGGARGRFETVWSPVEKVLGIVDYAHTPDALINVLATVNQVREPESKVITVIGCGGNRDKLKRPVMAVAACKHSDRVILTSDNPRNEDPEVILDEMEEGLNGNQKSKCLRITDRREAIKTACLLADAGDVLLVAGKGHETYQEIKGIKNHFDDKDELTKAFEILKK